MTRAETIEFEAALQGLMEHATYVYDLARRTSAPSQLEDFDDSDTSMEVDEARAQESFEEQTRERLSE